MGLSRHYLDGLSLHGRLSPALGFLSRLSFTFLSVRDGNTIVLRLQGAPTRCCRKGLAGR